MNRLQSGYRTSVPIGGQSVMVADSTLNYGGGMIVNPTTLQDQLIGGITVTSNVEIGPLNTFNFEEPILPINGIIFQTATQVVPFPEPLFVNLVEPASLIGDGDTVAIMPGQEFLVPPGVTVWVNATTSGHAFTAFFIVQFPNPNYPPTPIVSEFPPSGPTGLTQVIPSYLYQEYTDDDDLQAFVDAQNAQQQDYIDTFNALNLPIYTGSIISGALLDWVGKGLYGISRPSLITGESAQVGPLNTMALNMPVVAIDGFQQFSPSVVQANDDIYKRIITWHYQKGDGKYFSINWLKRRIMRFLIGVNGTSPPIDQTIQISINFGTDFVGIRFISGLRTVTGGCIPNLFAPGSLHSIDHINTNYVPYTPLPFIEQFQEALLTGVLETPFQIKFSVSVG
jgi:hypothetical protein